MENECADFSSDYFGGKSSIRRNRRKRRIKSLQASGLNGRNACDSHLWSAWEYGTAIISDNVRYVDRQKRDAMKLQGNLICPRQLVDNN